MAERRLHSIPGPAALFYFYLLAWLVVPRRRTGFWWGVYDVMATGAQWCDRVSDVAARRLRQLTDEDPDDVIPRQRTDG